MNSVKISSLTGSFRASILLLTASDLLSQDSINSEYYLVRPVTQHNNMQTPINAQCYCLPISLLTLVAMATSELKDVTWFFYMKVDLY